MTKKMIPSSRLPVTCRTRRRLRRWLRALTFGGLVCLCAPARSASGASQPNIVIIFADDMGFGDVGYLSSFHPVCGRQIRTPNIDSLAASGMFFTQGYVSSSVCSPSRCGLLTGVYQQRFGCGANPPEAGWPDKPKFPLAGLPRSQPMLSEILRSHGYHCGIVGKWHLGLHPKLRPPRRGFQTFFGFLNGAHSYLESEPTFGKRKDRWPVFRNDEVAGFHGYLTDVFTEEAIAFIRRRRQQPFFLYLAYNAVHGPWQATAAYLDRVRDVPLENRRLYAAMVLALDEGVGRVMQTLRRQGLSDNTVVIFISDNGAPHGQRRGTDPDDHMASNGPLRGWKGDVYEGGIRVPFIIRWPGVLPAGARCDEPVSTLDIAPTLLGYLGIPQPDVGFRFDGVNLLPCLTGKRQGPPHEVLYWRRTDDYAIRRGDWKLAFNDGRPSGARRVELFNLAEDIGEQHDLIDQHPDIARGLQAAFDAWDSALPPSPWWGAPSNRRGGRQ